MTFADQDFDKFKLGGAVRWTPPSDMTNITRFGVFGIASPDVDEENRTQLAEVSSDKSEAVLPLGTDPWPYAAVFVGSAGFYNLSTPAFVRMKDV